MIQDYSPITLEQMNSVKLMNRTDTKFVTDTHHLHMLLQMARDDYFVQETNGQRNCQYETTYFDTPHYDMYLQHQWGHANRQKIRFRTYVGSGLQFMEVKTKNNHGRTKKKRLAVSDMNLNDAAKSTFLTNYLRYAPSTLIPTMTNSFRRITLVNKAKTERLTIDTQLRFSNPVSGRTVDMGGLVVIELKRDAMTHSPVLHMLRQLHIHPHGFSKYCIGSALTNDTLPVNRFKLKLIEINKITQH